MNHLSAQAPSEQATPGQLPQPLAAGIPLSALAPMQDVTTLGFMQIIGRTGPPDYLFTEFFRVHAHSRLEAHIVRSIEAHGTGRPIFAQIIGEDLDSIARTIQDLSRLPIAGVDLNLGCPAPKVYKKNVGGGLLRDPQRTAEIIAFMRAQISGLFTVKMRLGFEDTNPFEAILRAIGESKVDLLTIHGRTVADSYRGAVRYELIREAVRQVDCPVLANGGMTSARHAEEVLKQTGAAGVMLGRAAIRNPWIFRQLRERLTGQEPFQPTLADARAYVDDLVVMDGPTEVPEQRKAGRLKKFLNFVSLSIDPEARFQYQMRRAKTVAQLLEVCDAFMTAGDRSEQPFPEEPYGGFVARENCESCQS